MLGIVMLQLNLYETDLWNCSSIYEDLHRLSDLSANMCKSSKILKQYDFK